MRLNNVTLRGITRFTDSEPVRIDFDGLGPGLVALVGPNGAGKSTLLEAVPAALYKSLPTRPGSLYDHAHGRDAFIEAVFTNDRHELKARVQIDAEQRKTEAYLFEDGQSLTTGRAAEFEAEIVRRFGSRELFLASVLAAQNKAGDFLRMAKRDRKALFVELLGLSYLQVLHEAAKERRAGAEKDLGAARAVLQSLEQELAALPGLEEQLTVARTDVEAAAGRLENERTEEAAAASTLERARSAKDQLKVHESAFHAADHEAEMARSVFYEAEALPQRIEAQSRQRLAALEAQDPEVLVRRAHERHESGKKACLARRETLEGVIAKEPEVEAARREVPALEAELAELEASERKLRDLRSEETVADARLTNAEQRLADARAAKEAERKRLERQAKLLDQVPCTEAQYWSQGDPGPGNAYGGASQPDRDLASACPLLSEARGARDELATADPELDTSEVEAARENLETVRGGIQDTSLSCDPLRLKEISGTALPAARATASEASSIERAKRDLDSIEKELEQLAKDLERDLQDASAARERIAAEREQITEERKESLEEAAVKAARARKTLEDAIARRAEAEMTLRQAEALAEGLHVSTCQQRHVEAEMARKRAERELREADQKLAGIAARVEQLQERARSLHTHREAVLDAETEVGDWSLLERALGRDGVQALEIDAAGPEVARLANELLEACYGSRFSIAFETLREKKSSKGEYTESFDVHVYDQGRPRPVEALSGGERVVVGEAIGLAFSILNARKSGVRWETLFRDETAGALDPVNAQAYVEMLRRALSLGGFQQVVFVSHQPEVWERADARVLVENGGVRSTA